MARYISFALLALLSLLPLAVKADSVGAVNADGYYVATLPWAESFDNFNANYDGTSYLPNGWMASGDRPFITANTSKLAARTGSYYMVTDGSPAARCDRAYTPYFQLAKGGSYTFSFWVYMPGQKGYGTSNTLLLTAGVEQDYALQTDTLLALDGAYDGWTRFAAKYVPSESGLHCFCFHLTTQVPLSGVVAIEDVGLVDENQVLPPTADFAVDGNVSFMTDAYVQFPGGALTLTNMSAEATDYEWLIPGAEPSRGTTKDLRVSFPESGYYTITLTAHNAAGSHSSSQTILVDYIDRDEPWMNFQNFSGYTDKTLSRGFVPCFPSDPESDFYTGPNHYYHATAERYELPEGQVLNIQRVQYYLTNFTMMQSNQSTTWPVQKDVQVAVRLVGETNGLPDESKVFGEKVGPIREMVGDRGIGVITPKEFYFDTPIRVDGTFYVVLDISEDFLVEAPDRNLMRSHLGISPCLHRSGKASMYVRPHHNLDGTPVTIAEGESAWRNAADFHPDMAGIGIAYFIWATSEVPEQVQPLQADGLPVATTTPAYDLQGRRIDSAAAVRPGIIITNRIKTLAK